MTFTYASTSTSITDLYWVRMRIGDTSSGTARFQDEELNNLISTYGNKYLAAAVAAETIGAQFAGRSDKTIGKLSISQGQLTQHYFDLGRRLRFEAGLFATPYAGGISADDKTSEEADSDRVKPAFEIGQFDYVADNSDSSTASF